MLKQQLEQIKTKKEDPPARAKSPPPAPPHRQPVVQLAGPSRKPPPAFTVELRPTSPPPRVMSPPGSPPVARKPVKKAPLPVPQHASHGEQAQGEIDKRHPGGVKTLKRAYETKVTTAPPMSSTMFSRPATNRFSQIYHDSSDNKESTVRFAESVQTIPKVQSPPISPKPTRRMSPPQNGVPPDPPPLPPVAATAPPPPPAVGPPNGKDKHGSTRAIRVGKIQWPPPRESTDRDSEVEVGRLQIDEKRINGSQRALRSKEDVHSRTMELIRSRSNEPIDEPKYKLEPRVSSKYIH